MFYQVSNCCCSVSVISTLFLSLIIKVANHGTTRIYPSVSNNHAYIACRHILYIQSHQTKKNWYIHAFIHVNPCHITYDKFGKALPVLQPASKIPDKNGNLLSTSSLISHRSLKNPVLWEARHAILLKV